MFFNPLYFFKRILGASGRSQDSCMLGKCSTSCATVLKLKFKILKLRAKNIWLSG